MYSNSVDSKAGASAPSERQPRGEDDDYSPLRNILTTRMAARGAGEWSLLPESVELKVTGRGVEAIEEVQCCAPATDAGGHERRQAAARTPYQT